MQTFQRIFDILIFGSVVLFALLAPLVKSLQSGFSEPPFVFADPQIHFPNWGNVVSGSNSKSNMKADTSTTLRTLSFPHAARNTTVTSRSLLAMDMTDPRTTEDCTVPIYLDPSKYIHQLNIPLGYWYVCADVKGQDLTQIIAPDMATADQKLMIYKTACDAEPSCEGFNSDGWLKYGSLRGRMFTKPEIDFYSKIPPICPMAIHIVETFGYWRLSCFDIGGHDTRRVRLRQSSKVASIMDVKRVCDDDKTCFGFNSAGWIKSFNSGRGFKFSTESDFFLRPSMESVVEIMSLKNQKPPG